MSEWVCRQGDARTCSWIVCWGVSSVQGDETLSGGTFDSFVMLGALIAIGNDFETVCIECRTAKFTR